MDSGNLGFLVGLDCLKKFGCVLDLFESKITFKSLGFSVQFLTDGEVSGMSEGPNKVEIELEKS